LVDLANEQLSIKKQCELLGLPRSSLYYECVDECELNLTLMKVIDEIYTESPFYGSRKMTEELENRGYRVNRKRIQRLMRIMGLEVLYAKPNLSKPDASHRKFPYLLRDLRIAAINQVWSSDITYIPIEKGYAYLTAVIDWYSKYVLAWRLSNNLESQFCLEALEESLEIGMPEIFNTDQGVQFTSCKYIEVLEMNKIRISMDGKGRALDNIVIERLWRTVKYEEVYCKCYESINDAQRNLEGYFKFYNHKRLHQALGYKTPYSIFTNRQKAQLMS
jgi:putative transposase